MAVNNKTSLVVNSVEQLVKDWLMPNKNITFDFYKKNFKDDKLKVASALRDDVNRIQKVFETIFYPKRVQGIEDYTLSTARRALKLKQDGREGFSNVKQPIIRTFVDRLLKGIAKANFSVKVNPVSSEYKNQVEAVQHAINRCFSTAKVKSKIGNIASSAFLNGNGFCKASFSTPKEKLENIKNPETREYVKIVDEYAKFDWVSEFNIYFEPTEKIRGSQRFVINRQIKPLKDVLRIISKMDESISPEHLMHIMQNPRPFSNKDYNLVRLMKYYDNACNLINNFNLEKTYQVAYNNEKVEYVEIWTPDTLSVCLNGYIVADTENPLKLRAKWHPFFSSHYTENPGIWISEGIGILLGDVQRGYDALFNLLLDQATMTASPMMMLSPWQQMTREDSDTKFTWKPWGIVMNAGPGTVSFLTPPSVDQGSVAILKDMLEMAQFNVAPATYADYNTQSRSAQDSMMRFEGLADTVALFVDSMSNMLNEVAQAWLLDMQEKMPETFQLPVFNAKGMVESWKNIKRTDLEGKFIFEWSSESIRDLNTVLEKQQLNDMIQFIGAFGVDWAGRSIVDKRKLLQHACKIFHIDEDIIMSDEEVTKLLEKAAVDQQEIAQKLSQMQAPQEQGQPPEEAPEAYPQDNVGKTVPEEEPDYASLF